MKRNAHHTKKGPGRVHRDGRIHREFQWMLRHAKLKIRKSGRLSRSVTFFRSLVGL